ncbi:MAG: NAD(+) synthase [Bacteroidales bacterium]|nr:NAD(+) synthase [Bacteroidales bacterium]
MNYGFIKVAAAIPKIKVGACNHNAQQIIEIIRDTEKEGVDVVVFPELVLTGSTCGDLFFQQSLLNKALNALNTIVSFTNGLEEVVILGMPLAEKGKLYNVAIVIQNGLIQGVVPKVILTNHSGRSESKWFSSNEFSLDGEISLFNEEIPFGKDLLFHLGESSFAIELGEELFAPNPPSTSMALQGAEVIFNLSAFSESVGQYEYLQNQVKQHSGQIIGGYVLASSGFGESTTNSVFGGKGFIAEQGKLLIKSKRFQMNSLYITSEIDTESLQIERMKNSLFQQSLEDYWSRTIVCKKRNSPLRLTRQYNPYPFVPQGEKLDARCEEILSIQAMGLAQRLQHIGCEQALVGISGGLDSTLALLVMVRSFDLLGLSRKGIIGVTMPGFGTSTRTYENAHRLMEELGISIKEIDIKEACLQHFKDINHDISVLDATYENAQARERVQILMDLANQMNGIVVGTGDLSELALGWTTYNGDHMSMYNVNVGVPKTLVKHLVEWIAIHESKDEIQKILLDIVDTPISPELTPSNSKGEIAQKTEDLVGPYVLHDFFLFYFIRYGFSPTKLYLLASYTFDKIYPKEEVKKSLKLFIRRFFIHQFKRSCLPDGPKIGSVSLSPRGDWMMPSDATVDEWIEEIEDLK